MRRDHLNRLCPRDIRPPECWDCPVDISPTDILAQRQHVWIAHSRLCPRDIRPPECWDCPVDISPTDILAQRQHVWIARPTLKAIDQQQSIAAAHSWPRYWTCPYFRCHSSRLNMFGTSTT